MCRIRPYAGAISVSFFAYCIAWRSRGRVNRRTICLIDNHARWWDAFWNDTWRGTVRRLRRDAAAGGCDRKTKNPPSFLCWIPRKKSHNDLLSCHAKGYGTTNSERDGIACLSSRTIRLQKNSRTEELENSFDISAIVLAWDLKISKECHSWFQKKISNLMRRRNFRRLWLKSYPAKKDLLFQNQRGSKYFRRRKLYF